MSKFFMCDSESREIEQLMMLVPNFLPRRSGVIVVQKFRNGEVANNIDCDYKQITAYCSKGRSSRAANQIPCGVFDYEEILCSCFEKCESHQLNLRLGDLIRNFDGEFFSSPKHRIRFERVCRIQDEAIETRSVTYLSALFLLTADVHFWRAAKDHIFTEHIDFKKMNLRDINTDGYALYQMAKTLIYGKEYIQLSEIEDKDLIGNQAFKAIIHSILITRYGARVLQMK
ncbi:MAG: hypothetical protein VB100_04930 [Angelakisella sp.]|nr:hypothetical protein [Angelakisella sp.]